MHRLTSLIRPIPDFPEQGVTFRDITPLLANPAGMRLAVHQLVHPFMVEPVDMVAGLEARGFIFGALCAQELGAGFVPLRKAGKLPHNTESVPYALEYGQNALEIHVDALGHGHRVLLVDDVIATGGTAAAGVALVQRLGGIVVGCSFLIELDDLRGREALEGQRVHTLLHY